MSICAPLRSTIKNITALIGLQKNQLLTLLMGVQNNMAAVETWGSLKSAGPLLCIYSKELKTGSEETITQPQSLPVICLPRGRNNWNVHGQVNRLRKVLSRAWCLVSQRNTLRKRCVNMHLMKLFHGKKEVNLVTGHSCSWLDGGRHAKGQTLPSTEGQTLLGNPRI